MIAWLLDRLGRTQCTVIGHSMGGAVAIMLAAKRPDLVGRLVLAESNLDAGGGFASKSVTAVPEHRYVETGHAALRMRLERASMGRTRRSWRWGCGRSRHRTPSTEAQPAWWPARSRAGVTGCMRWRCRACSFSASARYT